MSKNKVESKVQKVFGKFAVELENGATLFDTETEALAAETEFLKGAEFRDEAAAYCANQGIEGKNAKSKVNVLVSYFSWVEAGRPERAEEVAEEAAEEAAADDVAVTADVDDDTDDEEPVKF